MKDLENISKNLKKIIIEEQCQSNYKLGISYGEK